MVFDWVEERLLFNLLEFRNRSIDSIYILCIPTIPSSACRIWKGSETYFDSIPSTSSSFSMVVFNHNGYDANYWIKWSKLGSIVFGWCSWFWCWNRCSKLHNSSICYLHNFSSDFRSNDWQNGLLLLFVYLSWSLFHSSSNWILYRS